jgi:formylglycine-generating enzyme required for sulfatase activity
MTQEELRRAVVEPAVQVGLSYQPGLENRILDDVGDEPGNLPLLEFVLKGLWEERRGGELHHEAYDAMEGVEGAIAKRAEAVWTSLIDQGGENEERLRRVFLELVYSEEGAKDTRRRIELEKLGEGAGALVAELTRERLLVTGRDEATGKETLEVAHEALISNWERLQRWLDEDHDFRMWRQRLSVGLMEWVRTGRRDSGTLLRGGPLAEAERWLGARGEDLSSDECAFIRASTRTRKRRKWVQGVVAAVIFLILALISAWQYRELEVERAKSLPIEPDMAIIKPGRFTMRSLEGLKHERPPHEVVIKKRFAIGRFEVTFEEFDKFAYDTGRRPANDAGWGGVNRPVINVSWEDAKAYANWLSERTGKRYRLPTEAEWEYAARAGTETAYSFGDDDSKLGEYAWYFANSERSTHPVGQKSLMLGGFTTFTAMSGSGWRTTTTKATKGPLMMAVLGSINPGAPTGCYAAAAGASLRATAGRRIAASTGPITAAVVWAFASPGPLPLALDPLYPWPVFLTRSAEKGANSCRSEAGSA